MKKVLFLAYYFPPMGGGGVQRIAKFCKYLPQFGYEPAVLAAATVPDEEAEDRTLMQEVQNVRRYAIDLPNRNSCRTRLSHTAAGRFLNLHQGCLIDAAQQAGEIAVEQEKPDLICASVSPFYMAETARRLSAKYHIPWIVDMRDPWALDPINYYATKLHYLNDLHAMERACERSDAVIMNTPNSLAAARQHFYALDPDKFTCITNGWDADDFKSSPSSNDFDGSERPLVIVHTGVFHMRSVLRLNRPAGKSVKDWPRRFKNRVKYSIGNSNFLTRTPHHLFEAISCLLKEGKIAKNDIRIIFVGAYTPDDQALAKTHGVDEMVDYRGYLDHEHSVEVLSQADVLFLPLHQPQNGQFPLIVPGKTYEYLAAKKPILATVPKGDVQDFLEKAALGYVCEPDNADQIASTLLELLQRHKSPRRLDVRPNHAFIAQFERKQLTQQLAQLFDKVIMSSHSI